MLNQLPSLAAIETVLMKLNMKQKQLIYQIARLEYRIYKSLLKLNDVNELIMEEEQNIKSLNDAIQAAGKGKVAEKLMVWKVKAEYKLFKLNLRKNKIDITKLIINQSKLEQAKQALITLEADLAEIIVQKQNFSKKIKEIKTVISKGINYEYWERLKQRNEENPINQSIKTYLKENFKMAS